jgi:tetratricopeptide (TPR) repeat protein
MYNLLISLGIGLAVGLAIAFGTEFGWAAAVFPGMLAAVIAYFLLARRTWKQLSVIFEAMQADARAQKLDKAIQTLQGGFVLAPWQFLVAAQLHSNIGILHFLKGDHEAALPHLEKSFSRNWIARGMLGVERYRRKDLAGTRRVLEDAVKVNKKEGVLWSVYAWILENENRHEEAIDVLARAVKANPADEKLKGSLQALQNGKKLKLGKIYGEQWFQFMLERPPTQFGGPGFRGGRRAIYGRG